MRFVSVFLTTVSIKSMQQWYHQTKIGSAWLKRRPTAPTAFILSCWAVTLGFSEAGSQRVAFKDSSKSSQFPELSVRKWNLCWAESDEFQEVLFATVQQLQPFFFSCWKIIFWASKPSNISSKNTKQEAYSHQEQVIALSPSPDSKGYCPALVFLLSVQVTPECRQALCPGSRCMHAEAWFGNRQPCAARAPCSLHAQSFCYCHPNTSSLS